MEMNFQPLPFHFLAKVKSNLLHHAYFVRQSQKFLADSFLRLTYATTMARPASRTIAGEVSCQIDALATMFTDTVGQGTLIHI